MIELPTTATFAATLHDPRFVAAACIAVMSAVVRGFSGFGSALIYVPLMAAVYDPRIATVSFILIDYFCVAPFAARAFPQCNWREVVPAFVAAACAVPLGIMAQRATDPIALRWGMALFVLTFVVILIAGWRYRGKPSTPKAIGVGILSGFAGGATQMSGPPAILYWLGSQNPAATVRANLMVYLVLVGMTLVINYFVQGLVKADVIALALILWPAYTLSLFVGARTFRGASEILYRRIAYAIVAGAAIVSLPVFDSILR